MMGVSDPATIEINDSKVNVESVQVKGDESDPASVELNSNKVHVENVQHTSLVRNDESDPSTIESHIKVDVDTDKAVSVVSDVENSNELKNDTVAGSTEEDFEEGMTRNDNKITWQSFGTKVKSLFTFARVAFVVYFVSVVITLWNEGRTVQSLKNLDDGRESVLEFDVNNFTNTSIPTSYENQLIHAIGNVTTPVIVTDPIFGVSNQYNVTSSNKTSQNVKFLKLSRTISMYQWKEYSKNNHGDKTWSNNLLKSPYRRKKNPKSFPFQSVILEANPVYLGNKIELNEEIVSSVSWYTPLDTIDINHVLDASLRNRLTKFSSNGYFYQADNTTMSSSDQPNVGDVMITFEGMVPDTTSVITCLYPDIDQDGYHTLGSHDTDRAGQILLIERGKHTSTEMFNQAEHEITASALKLRIWGYVLMVVSILVFLAPSLEDTAFCSRFFPTLIVDVIFQYFECCGLIILTFPFIVAGIVAIPNFLFVVSLVWISYEPTIAIPVGLVSLCFVVFFAWKIPKRIEEVRYIDSPKESNDVLTDNINSSSPPQSMIPSNSLTEHDNIIDIEPLDEEGQMDDSKIDNDNRFSSTTIVNDKHV